LAAGAGAASFLVSLAGEHPPITIAAMPPARKPFVASSTLRYHGVFEVGGRSFDPARFFLMKFRGTGLRRLTGHEPDVLSHLQA